MLNASILDLDDVNTTRSPFAQGLLATTYLVFAILGTVGNLCVFIINYRWRGGISSFKVTSIFLLNLAVTDLGIAVGNLPFAFISICLNRWVFGGVFCMVNGFLAIYLPVVSTITILLITVHRALVVLNPFKANIVTKRGAVIACAISWIWSLVVPVPPLLGINNYHYSADRGFCRIKFVQNQQNEVDESKVQLGNAFSMIIVSLFVIIPLLVIVVLNFILLVTSWKLQLTLPQPQQPRRESLRRKSTMLADQKAFKTVSLVVGAFLMCWLPQVIITFLGILLKDKLKLPPEINTFQALLVMANSTINPFIYTYVNKDFRSRFVQILLCSAFSSHSSKSLNKQLSIRAGLNGDASCHGDAARYRLRHGSDLSRQNSADIPQPPPGSGGSVRSVNGGSARSNGHSCSGALELLPLHNGSHQHLSQL